jgi:hypothetical protein
VTEAPSFRRSLRSAAAASATPYGYTLTTWAAGTVSASVLGAPGLLEVLLFLSGAVAAFLGVEGTAYGTVRLLGPAPAPPAVPLWAHAHWLSAGGAVVLAWAADKVIDATAAWLVAGLLATGTYLLLGAAQTTLAARAAGAEG